MFYCVYVLHRKKTNPNPEKGTTESTSGTFVKADAQSLVSRRSVKTSFSFSCAFHSSALPGYRGRNVLRRLSFCRGAPVPQSLR